MHASILRCLLVPVITLLRKIEKILIDGVTKFGAYIDNAISL